MAVHRLSDIDPLTGTANCLACGPGTPLSRTVRRRSGWQCRTARRRERAAGPMGTLWRRDLYAELLERQGGGCAICGKATGGGSLRLAFDHRHSCCKEGCRKCIRGLLCIGCNTGLGKLGDTVEGLQRAIAYLESTERT